MCLPAELSTFPSWLCSFLKMVVEEELCKVIDAEHLCHLDAWNGYGCEKYGRTKGGRSVVGSCRSMIGIGRWRVLGDTEVDERGSLDLGWADPTVIGC